MKQSDIKTECELIYQNIRSMNFRLERLRSICKHPNTYKGNYSYRVGAVSEAVICSDCNEVVSTDFPKYVINRKDI